MTQFKWIDGVLYHRAEKADAHAVQREFDPFWKPSNSDESGRLLVGEAAPKLLTHPIICDCGGRSFSLRYGDYEIQATCDGCGAKESVYSG